MDTLRETQKKYCTRAMIMAIIVALGFVLAGQKPIAKGLILGTLFSIINFILMGETLPWRLGHTKRRATIFSLGSISFRYAVLAVPIFLGVRYPQFNLVTVVIGLFLVQLMILGEQIMRLTKSHRRKRG